MNNYQLAMSNEQLPMNREQITVNSGRKTLKEGASASDGVKKVCFSLLLTLLLLTFLGCQEPFSIDNAASIPAEKGSFSLTLSRGRTILPDAPGIEDFAVYNLAFTPANGGSAVDFDRTNETLSTERILLDVGTYNLVVTAYKDSGKTLLMARGISNSIEINPGQNTARAVTLEAQFTGGTGTFSWDITVPSDVTDASMTITPADEDGTDEQTVDLTEEQTAGTDTINYTGSVSLNSGQYGLTFNFEKDGKTVVWNELLYVYNYLESSFTTAFTNAHFSGTRYTVTFDSNGGSNVGESSVLHGGKVSAPPAPTKEGYPFLGWYTDNSVFEDAWDFDTAVFKDIHLYACWSFNLPLKVLGVIGLYLETQTGGAAADDPIGLQLQIDLGSMTQDGSGWRRLLDIIETSGKYVDIDLSASAMTGTDFNPDSSVETGKDKIVSITLPDTAAGITGGSYNNATFKNFTALTSFNGEGLTSIGAYAFENCTGLALTSLPEGLTTIGIGAFNGCTGLALTSLPEGLTSIGNTAFNGCTGLALTSLPEGLTSIGNYAFRDCIGLALTSLPEGLTSIGAYAFENCTGLTEITLPDGLTTIESYTFSGCTNLVSVTFNGTISSGNLGSNSFPGNLRTVYFAVGGGRGTYTRPSGSTTWTKISGVAAITVPFWREGDAVSTAPDFYSPRGKRQTRRAGR